MHARREFLKKVLFLAGTLCFGGRALGKDVVRFERRGDPECTVYRAVNGTPAANLQKVIELAGGIEKFVGPDDVVVIKPNVQWWNQGAPNLLSLKTFVDLIMERPGGFQGEVVLAENCHRGGRPWESAGWSHAFERNSDLENAGNMNELAQGLKQKYGERFSVCHWTDVDAGNRRVLGPQDGEGYVYCDGSNGGPLLAIDNGAEGSGKRSVVMSYPIFKTDSGKSIDFKNGVWEKGAYTGQLLKFINFAALNHHSSYCGVTSAVKNYLGVSDLSGGPDPASGGRLTGKYYNFHSFPFDKWSPGPAPGMLGAEIGYFMDKVRKADLNITTAEWVGLASRTEPPAARTRAVLASKDPVALDYHAAKYVLYPNSRARFHDPDNQKEPLYRYLKKCAEYRGGVFDEKQVAVESYDFKTGALQADDELVVVAEKEWGRDPKALLKYFLFRFGLV